ncbi:MAG: hypothetical protein JST98_11345 [Bacteroidetes bacterium]|nr:hypothetical protein [Bacteroidota bacterium]
MSTPNGIDTLESIALRLRRESESLITQGQTKAMAAKAIEDELVSLKATIRNVTERHDMSRTETLSDISGSSASHQGWAEFIRANVGEKPVTVDDLLAIAKNQGLWLDLADKVRRTRLRTTLHIMKKRDLQQTNDGQWVKR